MDIKEWVEHELEVSKRICNSREEMLRNCTYCMGAVMFAESAGLITYEEVDEWWSEIRNEFWNGPYYGEDA